MARERLGKRASYKHAIAWIAANDSAGDDLSQQQCSELVTAVLVADLFEVSSEKVGADIMRARHLNKAWDASEAAQTIQERR